MNWDNLIAQVTHFTVHPKHLQEEIVKAMRREFCILVNRCGCSKASLEITPEEAEKMTREGLGVITPSTPCCTPKKCFPIFYKLLYPKGGFNKVSYMTDNFRRGRKYSETLQARNGYQ